MPDVLEISVLAHGQCMFVNVTNPCAPCQHSVTIKTLVRHISNQTCSLLNCCSVLTCLRVVSGQYTCKEGKNSPCLVYVSFSHKIHIYWKVGLERMESTNMLKVLEEKPEFKSHLRTLGVGE